jgi:hypothetical protein
VLERRRQSSKCTGTGRQVFDRVRKRLQQPDGILFVSDFACALNVDRTESYLLRHSSLVLF